MYVQFAYFVEDGYLFGDIDDLAGAMQNSYYAGFSVEDYVTIFDEKHNPLNLKVRKVSSEYDANDYAVVTISIIFPPYLNHNSDEFFELTSSYTVDGRA